MTQKEEEILDEEGAQEEKTEAPKPHIPAPKVSRFGPQMGSRFGK